MQKDKMAVQNMTYRHHLALPQKRIGADSPDIVYYFSKPSRDKFPIAILVGGSSLEDDIISIIHFHRYF